MSVHPAIAVLLRHELAAFLKKVFETLHPGEPPLELSWYLHAVCFAVVRTMDGGDPRLVITIPPRHLKSIALAVALPAWLLGRNPNMKIMIASYSQDLARQHAEQCRTVLESPWYKAIFPATRISDRGNRALELVTTKGGGRKAVSVEGSITGFGADVIILDDCMKADEVHSQVERDRIKRWFEHTLVTRLNDKRTGVIISIQQRLHEDDLPAYLLEKGYPHLNLPAIAEVEDHIPIGDGRSHHRRVGDLLSPNREPREVLERLRRELGPRAFSAQYQQQPVTPDGNLIRLDWFETYDGQAKRHHFRKVVQSWDTASTATPTSDWSVCTTWGYVDDQWWLVDVFRDRLELPDLKRAVLRLKALWTPKLVLIENANSGQGVHQILWADGVRGIQLINPKGDKQQRVIDITGELDSGRFVLPVEAPWLAAFRSELRAFPDGKYDDQVDSLSQFVSFQLRNWKWALQEYTATGRLKANVRQRSR